MTWLVISAVIAVVWTYIEAKDKPGRNPVPVVLIVSFLIVYVGGWAIVLLLEILGIIWDGRSGYYWDR